MMMMMRPISFLFFAQLQLIPPNNTKVLFFSPQGRKLDYPTSITLPKKILTITQRASRVTSVDIERHPTFKMPEARTRKPFMRPIQGRMPRMVCGFITTIVVIVGLIVLITWLSLQPHKPKYYLDYGSSTLFTLSDNGLVSSKMQFNLSTRNSNKKIGIYYDRIGAMMSYDGDYFAWGSMLPFYQGHKNTTRLHTTLIGDAVSLQGVKSHDLRLEHSSGKVDLALEVYASIRFKVGKWKSGHYKLQVKCRPARLDVTHGTFQRTQCKVKV